MDFEDWGVLKVYRRMRDDEDVRDGLKAKAPDANLSVQDHIENGSRSWHRSQYMSCCKTKYAMQRWILMGQRTFPNAPVRVAEIDVSGTIDGGEDVEFIDLTRPNVCNIYLSTMKARRYSGLYEEVLLVGKIGRRYIRQFDVFLDIPIEPTPKRATSPRRNVQIKPTPRRVPTTQPSLNVDFVIDIPDEHTARRLPTSRPEINVVNETHVRPTPVPKPTPRPANQPQLHPVPVRPAASVGQQAFPEPRQSYGTGIYRATVAPPEPRREDRLCERCCVIL